MSIPFITRPPTPQEIERWRLIMSTFNDGSGQERDLEGNTRLGWRDIERVAAISLTGKGGEDKQIFDVLIPSTQKPSTYYGCSVKSKKLSMNGFAELENSGRCYMELCNSPAKLWNPLKAAGFNEAHFSAKKNDSDIGGIVLQTVEQWHEEYARVFQAKNKNCILDIENSIYLTVSYNNPKKGENREYQIHAFKLEFPKGIRWEYNTDRCLRGYDPEFPEETLFDWYGLSGGQLKYYPRASKAIYKSPKFKLLNPRKMTLEEKASRYFPLEWKAAGGPITIAPADFSKEMENISSLMNDQNAANLLKDSARQLAKF